MNIFEVDQTLCVQCGLCALECPVACIEFGNGRYPASHEKKHRYCIECGHCVAVCPTGAIALERLGGAGEAMDAESVSTPAALHFLKSRRSVRTFKKKEVDQSLLVQLLDVTQYAPSGHNARPVAWSVAATGDQVRAVAGLTVDWMRGEVSQESALARALHLQGVVRLWDEGVDLVCRHAPVLAVAHVPERGITPMEDCVLGVAYLELAAYGAGLGACWCGYVQMAAARFEPLRELLAIPARRKVGGALMLGYGARPFHSLPPRPGAEVRWVRDNLMKI